MNPLLLALALQGSVLDAGTLVVRRDTSEIAREDFHLAVGRPGTGGPGWTLASSIRYHRIRPAVVLSPILEIDRDSIVVTMQYDVTDPRQSLRILGEAGRGRFTVRLLAQHSERAREFPLDGRTVVLDDSVYAPYVLAAWRAAPTPARLYAVVPRALRRDALTGQAHGEAETRLNRATVPLSHITLQGGPNQLVHLWLDARARLMKVEIPSRRVTVERAPEG
jgi:hypothetical protein